MFFSSWAALIRVIVVGVLAYISLVALLRISGKRTLSKMNAFDLVVTVAIGSTLATVLLSKDVALADGIVGFAVLIGMQFVITWLSVRSSHVREFVKSEPTLVVYQGKLLPDALRRTRVVEAEVLQALRSTGVASVQQVAAVVLETDGSFSVIQQAQPGKATAMADVDHWPGES